MTLVIGGPEHGKMVDWPLTSNHYAVAVNEYNLLTETTYQTRYYSRYNLVLFNYVCPVWFFERLNPENSRDLLLNEILSLKGAHLINSHIKDESV